MNQWKNVDMKLKEKISRGVKIIEVHLVMLIDS